MAMLYLTKDQMRTVHSALENHHRDLKGQVQDKPNEVQQLVAGELFQLDLLITWFDRQRELECE